jgi:hypothetical protein
MVQKRYMWNNILDIINEQERSQISTQNHIIHFLYNTTQLDSTNAYHGWVLGNND